MNISEFNYYYNLKNRLAKVQDEINLAKKSYLKQITNLNQLKNDYDVNTVEELASVLNNGNENQDSFDLQTALQNRDKNYLIDNMKWISHSEFENINNMYDESNQVEKTLEQAASFYNDFALPTLNKLEKSHLIRIDEFKSSGDDVDSVLEFDYFSTYDDFKEDFSNAEYVPEIVKEHLEKNQSLSMTITLNNYPNQYDITIMPIKGEN